MPQTQERPCHSCDTLRTSAGFVKLCRSAGDVEPQLWEAAFGAHAKDGRFYRIAEGCLGEQFEFLYLVLRNEQTGEAALQPAIVVDQDGGAGLPKRARDFIATLRKFYPRLLRMKLLMVGCAAGEGIPGSTERWALEALHEALPCVARAAGASVIVLKDFPSDYRAVLGPVFERDYRRVPGLPAAYLDLDYASFDDYLQTRVGKVFRKNLRRKFKKLQSAPPITMEVVADVTPWIDEIFPLYWQMFRRSELQFEVLNREYFERLGQEMPDKIRFFIWRQQGRIIAFNSCLVHDGVLYDLDIGMDYGVALDLHMYFVTWRDVVLWCIEQGLKTYHAGPLNYDPKLHLRMRLAPQDLYARHVSKWLNPFFKIAMQFAHPVRHNPIIREFENFSEV